jgi:hypothetical protein
MAERPRFARTGTVTEAQTRTREGGRTSAVELATNMATVFRPNTNISDLPIASPGGGAREPMVATTNVANFSPAAGVNVTITPAQGRALAVLAVANEGIETMGVRTGRADGVRPVGRPTPFRDAVAERVGQDFDAIVAAASMPGAPAAADVQAQINKRAQEYFNREALAGGAEAMQRNPRFQITDAQFDAMGINAAARTAMRARATASLDAVRTATNALPSGTAEERAQRTALTSPAGRAALLRAGAENPALMDALVAATTAAPPVPANVTAALTALKDAVPAADRRRLSIAMNTGMPDGININPEDRALLVSLGGPQPTEGPGGGRQNTANGVIPNVPGAVIS